MNQLKQMQMFVVLMQNENHENLSQSAAWFCTFVSNTLFFPIWVVRVYPSDFPIHSL